MVAILEYSKALQFFSRDPNLHIQVRDINFEWSFERPSSKFRIRVIFLSAIFRISFFCFSDWFRTQKTNLQFWILNFMASMLNYVLYLAMNMVPNVGINMATNVGIWWQRSSRKWLVRSRLCSFLKMKDVLGCSASVSCATAVGAFKHRRSSPPIFRFCNLGLEPCGGRAQCRHRKLLIWCVSWILI